MTAFCLLLLAPLALVDVPPLLDYPNHLARAFVLASGPGDAVLSEFYRPHWGILPNLATDAVLTPVLRRLPEGAHWVHLAGRIMVGAFLLLPVLGTVAYSRAVFGRWSWWPLGCGLVAYNAAFLQGFLNFSASISLALLCAAAWRCWRRAFPMRMIGAAAVATAVLFFCHLMGLGFFLLLMAAAEVEAAWKNAGTSGGIGFMAAVARRALACLPVLVLPAILYVTSEFGQADAEPQWRSLSDKFAHLLDPVINYDLATDGLTAIAIIGVLVLAAVTGCLRVPVASRLVLGVLLALYAIAPFDYKGSAAFDMRFVIMAAFMLFAAMLPSLPRRTQRLAAASFATLFVVRMAIIGAVWIERGDDLAQFRQMIAAVPVGSRVYLTSVAPVDAPDYWRRNPHGLLSDGTRTDFHIAALLVIERRSFWPYLFAYASQQPIELMPRYMALAEQTNAMSGSEFVASCRAGAAPADLEKAICGYDYLLMLEPAALPGPQRCAPQRLSLIASTNMAALFQVKPGACAIPAGTQGPQSAVTRFSG